MIAASEALMLAKRLKMDLKKVHEIMKNASGNNWALSTYTPLPNLTDGVPSNNKYRPGFSAAMMTKDLKLANDAAKSVNASTPLGKHALEILVSFVMTEIAKQIILEFQKKLVEMLGITHLIQRVKINLETIKIKYKNYI